MTETYTIISQNKEKALTLVYERYGKKLYGYAKYTWKMNEDESWDMIYKTIYKVMESAPSYKFESEQKFASFVFKIFINYLRNHYRDKKNKYQPILVELNENTRGYSAQSKQSDNENNPLLNVLNEELNKLDDWQRILLLMRAQDVSYADIALYVEKPEDQLKVYYMRLKKQLTENMNEHLNKISDVNRK